MAGIFLESNDTGYAVVNDNDKVYGSTGTESVSVYSTSGTDTKALEIDANVEQVNFQDALRAYKFKQSGADLLVYDADNADALVATIHTGGGMKVSFGGTSAVDVVISSGTMSIDGNPITESIANLSVAKTAAEINAANDATSNFVDYSDVTLITGSASEIGTMLSNKGTSGDKIGLASDVALTITGTATVTQLNTIDSATTGVITATVTDSISGLGTAIDNANSNNVVTVTIADTAENLKTDADTNSGAGTILANNYATTVTDNATVAQLNAIDSATTGVITATIADDSTGFGTAITDANTNNVITAITATDAVTVSMFNTLDTKTTGVVTATISDDSTGFGTTIADTNSNNVISAITATDAVTVSMFNTLDTKTTGIVTATIADDSTGFATTIADSNTNNVITAISATDALTVSLLNTLDAKTTGVVTAAVSDTISGFGTTIADANSNNSLTHVTVSDTASNIQALTAQNFTDYTYVDTYDSTDNTLTLTYDQATAMTSAKKASDDVVTVAYTFTDGTTITAQDGFVETFTYDIDSSGPEKVISGLTADVILAGFNVTEDSLIFRDADTDDVVSKENFISYADISKSSTNKLTDIIFNNNSDGDAYKLTLNGIVDENEDLSTLEHMSIVSA